MNMEKDLRKILSTNNPKKIEQNWALQPTSYAYFYENLESKKPLVPETGMGQLTGKWSCEIGIWLGTANGCCPAAMYGGLEHHCNDCAAVLPEKNRQIWQYKTTVYSVQKNSLC